MRRLVTSILASLLLAACAFGQAPPPPAPPITSNQITLPVISQLQSVSSAAIQTVGNPGPQTIFYWIVANYTVGSTAPAGPFFTSSAPNTLSGSNYVAILPQYPAGAISVDVLKTSNNVQPSGTCNCAVATRVASGTINDQSNSTSSYTVTPIDTAALAISLQNEVQASGVTHLILRQGGAFVADLSVGMAGGQASLQVAPPIIDFNQVQVGQPSPVQNIIISNASTAASATVNVSISGNADFQSTSIGICNGNIGPGASCAVPFLFNPSTAAFEQATVTITSSAPVNPSTITLQGTGIAGPSYPLTVNSSSTMTGAGVITSNETDPRINCHLVAGMPPAAVGDGTCSSNYAAGAQPVLTATPDTNQTFGGFTGGCVSSTSSCTLPAIGAAATVTGTFTAPIPQFILGLVGTGQGTGTTISNVNDAVDGNPINCTSTAGVLTGKCTGKFNQGTDVTLTETPFAGCTGGACTFISYGGASGCSNIAACHVIVNSNITVSTGFAAPTASAPVQLLPGKIQGGTPGTNSITGSFSDAASAGDTYFIAIQLNDNTTTVTSVTDTKGDTFTQLGGGCSPKTVSGATNLTEAVYYAQNVAAAAANSNTITVNLSASPSSRQMIGHHVSGLTATPFDVCSGGTGTGTALNSGNFTSSVAGDYLVSFSTVAFHITTAGAGWTQETVVNGNDSEDQFNVAAATYSNQPTQSTSGTWIDIAAAFKAGSGGTGVTNYAFNVSCAPSNGVGSVTASGQTLTCNAGSQSGGISLQVAPNSSQSVLATPQPGSVFGTYVGSTCNTNPSCTIQSVTANTSLTASFNLTAGGAQAYYVDLNSGNDSNSGLCAVAGTPAGCTGPWRTLAHADAALTVGAGGTCTAAAGWVTYNNAGACVHVLNGGTYSGGNFSTTKNGSILAQIYFVSDTRYGAKIQNSTWTQFGNYSNIEGFEFTGASTANAVTVQTGNNRGVDYNYIHDFGTSTCFRAGLINQTNLPAANDHFIGNVIRQWGNTSSSACTATYHGIYSDGGAVTIEDNIFSGGTGGWAIQRQYQSGHGAASDCAPGSISNNTIFNVQGGIVINENSSGCTFSNWVLSNNIIVNNGIPGTCFGTCGGSSFGIDYYGFSGSGNVVSSNLMYGNVPANFGNHGNTCTPGASNCPSTNLKSDANTSVTFVSFQTDTRSAPASVYNAQNYVIGGSSATKDGGSSQCAGSGISPCMPIVDFNLANRPLGPAIDIGAFEVP